MVLAIVSAVSVVSGILQTVTGFGSAVVLMMVVPSFFDLVTSSAISSSISMGIGIALAWNFRKEIEWKVCVLPAVLYLVSSVAVVYVVKDINLDVLTMAFGIFLVILALYFLLFSDRVSFEANWKTASLCSICSGITAGLFSIGGPLMALYFVAASRDKESYIGNIQFSFTVSNIMTFLTRINRGIYTMEMLPVTLFGLAGIMLGREIGLKILNRIDLNMVKKGVYGLVAISGVLTIVQNL